MAVLGSLHPARHPSCGSITHSPPAVAMFAYLLNTASTLLAAAGPATRRADAVRNKLEARWGRLRAGGGEVERADGGPLCLATLPCSGGALVPLCVH